MHERKSTIEKLEYDKIIRLLIKEAVSDLAVERIKLIEPSKNLEEIKIMQQETFEAYEVLRLNPQFSLQGFSDIKIFLKRAALGISLEPDDFLKITFTIKSGAKVKSFFESIREEYLLILVQAQRIGNFNKLAKNIDKTISPEGMVFRDATPQLKSINRAIADSKDKIKTKLQSMIHSTQMQKKLQEQIVTIRNDRYVVPVKQEYVSEVPGLVHDHSASGATVFIEPMAVVELNNKLKQLAVQKNAEEVKILNELTGLVAADGAALNELIEALTLLDMFFSKAKLATKLKATKPLLNTEGNVKLKQARHPLIDSAEVVPIDFWMGKEFSMVVITGPNTGGKTVALKTVGLLTLMAQAGLFIPAEEGSQIAVVDEVYADIGDEQSLEQSLSTFSSHMTNIIEILQKATADSLILFDELGAGTDPIEGAALARAILEHVHSKGSLTIATTHYGALKHFAYNTEGVENASVEFNPLTLRPTFRLLMGLPGKSNAFEISERLGLKSEIIEKAKGFMDADEIEIGDLIQSLEQTRSELENEKQEILNQKKEIFKVKETLEEKLQNFKEKEANLITKAAIEAKELLKQTKMEVKQITQSLKMTKEVQEAQDKLKKMDDELAVQLLQYEEKHMGTIPQNLQIGEEVYIPRLNKNGMVLAYHRDSEEVLVQIGIMKISVNIGEVRVIEFDGGVGKKNLKSKVALISDKSQTISPEIDLRGLNSEEAIKTIEKYLDDALITGLNQVALIHGKGTGILAKNIQEYLKKHPQVSEFRFGMQGEGGYGVTIVKL